MATPKTTAASEPIAPRHLWLAGLGLAVVARREVRSAACKALTAAGALRDRSATAVADAVAIARGAALTLREKIEPALGELGEAVEARFPPLFAGLGVPRPQAARAPHKRRRPAAKKTPSPRRTPRKAAPRKTAPRKAGTAS